MCLMVSEFFRADGRTDGKTYYMTEANNHIFAIFQMFLKTVHPMSYYYKKLEVGTRCQEVSGSNLGREL